MSDSNFDNESVHHGVEGAFYNSDGEKYLPVIDCLCGWSTGRQFNWEDAGAEFDRHLKESQ
jgi:hypothetical protein